MVGRDPPRHRGDRTRAVRRKRSRIEILNQTSEEALADVLPAVERDKPILFWLDAHFPGADFGLATYKDEHGREPALPLERELALIAKLAGRAATCC